MKCFVQGLVPIYEMLCSSSGPNILNVMVWSQYIKCDGVCNALFKVWSQYMKCDGLPDPVCVRQLNTYLSLWVEDNRETIDAVLVTRFF